MKYSVLVLLAVLLLSCGGSIDEEDSLVSQDSVLSVAEMEAVLFDMYLTEAFIRQKERDGKNNIYYSEHYYNLMLEKHQLDTTKLLSSYEYYASKPEVFKEINQKVLDSLIVLETHLPADE